MFMNEILRRVKELEDENIPGQVDLCMNEIL
jgi:hypothetical protein